MRSVGAERSIAASINSDPAMAILPQLAGQAVVTRVAYSVGEKYHWGSLIGAVSGRPYFGLPSPLPLYRDLVVNDRGDDVRALQRSLSEVGYSVEVDGVIGRETMDAVEAVFEASGFELEDPGAIPHTQLVGVEADGLEVTEIAEVGSRLTDDDSLVKLKSERKFVSFYADAVYAASLRAGQRMRVQTKMKTVEAVIAWIGPYGEKDASRPSGHEIRLVAEGDEIREHADGTAAVVAKVEEPVPTLAVPLSAIRQDSSGAYVELETRSASGLKVERRSVEILRTSEGWAAISGSGLTAGDKVDAG